MRKMIFILICAALVSITGCSLTKQERPDRDSPPNLSANASDEMGTYQPPIEQDQHEQGHKENLLSLDFTGLQNAITESVGTEHISASFMYNTHPIDIFFLPTGEITQCRVCVWSLDSEVSGDYVMSEYQTSGLPETTAFDVTCTKPSLHFAKELFDFDFDGFAKLTSWIENIDFKALINRIPDTPFGYRFVSGLIPAEIIDSHQVSYTALDLSSGTPAEIDLTLLPRIPDVYYLEYDLSSQYYALIPYYPANEAPGYSVPMDEPVDELTLMDYSAPDDGEYNLNNILLLFPNGISN